MAISQGAQHAYTNTYSVITFIWHYSCLKSAFISKILHLTLRKCTGSWHRCRRMNQVSTHPTASLQCTAHTAARVTSETTRNTETKRQNLPSSADFILAGRVLRNGSPRSVPKLNLGLTLRQKVSCIQQAMRATSREAFTLKKKIK